LATPTAPVNDYSHAEPSLVDYTSMMLQMYFETLDRYSTATVLDVGPVCKENITYFAQRVKRLYVCDLFLRLHRNRRKGLPAMNVLGHLDYEPHSFDGINLWDLIDHLNDADISRLLNLCYTLLEPRGLMIITSFEAQSAPSKIHSFVMKDGYHLTFRLQNHLDLPCYHRSNRIVTGMLSEFRTVKSFLYRNGVREFLCRRD
jgi:hypothetical protein